MAIPFTQFGTGGAGFDLGNLLPDQGPASNYANEFEAAMRPDYEAQRAALASQAAANQAMAQQMMAHVQGMQPPAAPYAVPNPPSPALAALAGFFAHLHAAQTGSGALPSAVMGAIAQNNAQRQAAISANAEASRQFAQTKLEGTEKVYEKMLEMQRDAAVEAGNLEAAFKHQKSMYQLSNTQHKRETDEANQAKERLAAANSNRIMQRGLALARIHERTSANSLDQKIKYQSELVRLGLKASPAVAAQERQINADAAASLAQLRTNAQISLQPLDEDAYNSILAKRDADINALYAANLPRVAADGSVLPPAGTPGTPGTGDKRKPLGQILGK